MPDHLRAMRGALESRPRGKTPTVETIQAKLGAFSSASDGTDGKGPEKRERRRRG